MRTISLLIGGCALVWGALSPGSALAQKVGYDVRPRTDFAAYRTFAFKDADNEAPTASQKHTLYDAPLVLERTHAAIAAQLESRGLKRDDGQPDVYISAHRTFKKEYTVYGSSWGYPGYGPYWAPYWGYGPSWTSSYVDETIIGTLIIDVADAATGALLWRGTGEKHVHERSSPEKRDERVAKEVSKIFKNFPRTTQAMLEPREGASARTN